MKPKYVNINIQGNSNFTKFKQNSLHKNRKKPKFNNTFNNIDPKKDVNNIRLFNETTYSLNQNPGNPSQLASRSTIENREMDQSKIQIDTLSQNESVEFFKSNTANNSSH